MSKERNQPNYNRRRLVVGVGALAAVAALGMGMKASAERLGDSQEVFPTVDQPHKEVVVTDMRDGHGTAWGIAEDAFPDEDPRQYTDDILAQIPEGQQTLREGEVIILPTSAAIGELVDPPQDKN